MMICKIQLFKNGNGLQEGGTRPFEKVKNVLYWVFPTWESMQTCFAWEITMKKSLFTGDTRALSSFRQLSSNLTC